LKQLSGLLVEEMEKNEKLNIHTLCSESRTYVGLLRMDLAVLRVFNSVFIITGS